MFVWLADTSTDNLDGLFGSVAKTPGVEPYDTAAGGIGLILFISTLIRFATIAAGIYVMINFVLAGFEYITSNGDTGAHKKVRDRLTMSVLGLAVIVASYTIIGIIGLVLFGDAGYILSPTLTPPVAVPAATD